MRFRLKIALCVSVLLAFAFSLGATLIISISFRTALEEQRRIADENYSFLAHTLVSVSKNPDNLQIPEIEDFFSLLESGENRNYAAVQVEIGDYLIYESAGSYPFRAIPAYHDLRAVEIFSSDDETVYMQISSNIVTHTTTYRMSILYDISAPYTAREEMLAIYRLVFCVILILGVAVSLLLGHVLARPLVSLSEASRRINAGELSCRAQRMSGDEVGDLAEDFNAMADRLEGQIHDLEDAVARQERFTASFAHEMRTPMTSIIGYAELLRAGDLPEGDAETALGYIYSEGKRLQSLSTRLLELLVLRSEEIRVERVDLAFFLQTVETALAPEMGACGITLCCEGEGEAEFEPDLVKSLVINLADNARKASKADSCVRITAKSDGEICTISVSDEGEGIPEEAIAHLTEVFYRVDKSRSRANGGAGLGLSIAALIAQLHGGRLSFFSKPGGGTRVSFEFPAKGGEE